MGDEIQYKNRNPIDNSVLESLKDIGTNPNVLIDAGEYFYRARIITDHNRLNKEKGYWGYSREESFLPPADMTKDMRANYKYIPYLYCSNSPYIALREVQLPEKNRDHNLNSTNKWTRPLWKQKEKSKLLFKIK